MRLARALLTGMLASVIAALPAQAQTPDPAAAERLLREGQKLLAAGKVEQACRKLTDSYALDPALGTLFSLASCHEREGEAYTALREFRALAEKARRANQSDREVVAMKHIANLEPLLPRVRVIPPKASAVTAISVDGSPEPLTTDAFAIGSGPHVIDVVLDNGTRDTVHVTMPPRPGEVTDVTVEGTPPDKPEAPSSTAPPPVPAPVPDRGQRPIIAKQREVGFIVGGVGAVSLVAGGVFGAMTFSAKDAAGRNCDATGACTAQGKHDGDLAHRYATASTILVGVGAAGLAVGGFLIFTAPKAPSSNVRFAIGPQSVVLDGAW